MVSLPNPKFSFPSTINVANFVTLMLNDNDYLLWETQVLSLIESQDLLGFLTGETVALPKMSNSESGATVNNPDYTSWVWTDRLVKSWIVGTLSEEVLDQAVGLQTAAELQHIRKGNNPLPTYLRNFKSICDQLHAIGKPVSDSTKVFRLLEGLDESYEPFKSTMFRPPIPLYTEGPNGDAEATSTEAEVEAITSTLEAEVFLRRPKVAEQGAINLLRRLGVIVYQSDDMPRGLAALHITNVHDDEWHPDTSANAHITDKPGNLTNLVPYFGYDSVMVGDGTFLPITHIATTSIGDLLHWGSTLGFANSTQSSRTSLFDSTDPREVALLFSDEVTTTSSTNLHPTNPPALRLCLQSMPHQLRQKWPLPLCILW
uniref:Retrotransposon Copia-like N-terminal domain-containing protein n=1 Tax=Ananas comosus var. bracteatus TaxID=296719 RepID=A0A6V7QC81_ANACO|nr:unnamed protein product [Ananas comosus var. bracteatus]